MSENLVRYLENWRDERNSVALYDALAEIESQPAIQEVYRRLARTEEKHAVIWETYILSAGGIVPRFSPSWRVRTMAWLARRLGIDFVLPSLSSLERKNSGAYAAQLEGQGLVAEEQSHAILLQELSKSSHGQGMPGSALARLEGLHRAGGGNALRAAVLGASDGLLSNFNLVMGVAGAAVESHTILLTGLAGLLAGAISMALGEWISVQSSRELYERQIATEKEEIFSAPQEETDELTLIYQARGLDEATARDLATKLMSNPETALEALARDELGIDPEELGGSAWEAAFTSFALFTVGAVIPVVPYLFFGGGVAVIISAVVSSIGLFGVGAAITLYTGKPVLHSGIRQVAFGVVAAGVTYGVGHFLGSKLVG